MRSALDQSETRKDTVRQQKCKQLNIHILSLQFFVSMDVLPHTLTHGLLLEIQFSFQPFLLMHLYFHEIFMNCSQCNVLKIEDFLVKMYIYEKKSL